jgi:hypothetical protein
MAESFLGEQVSLALRARPEQWRQLIDDASGGKAVWDFIERPETQVRSPPGSLRGLRSCTRRSRWPERVGCGEARDSSAATAAPVHGWNGSGLGVVRLRVMIGSIEWAVCVRVCWAGRNRLPRDDVPSRYCPAKGVHTTLRSSHPQLRAGPAPKRAFLVFFGH